MVKWVANVSVTCLLSCMIAMGVTPEEAAPLESWTGGASDDYHEAPGIHETSPGDSTATGILVSPQAVGPISPAAFQSTGALTGRIVFTSAGHGWTWGGSSWVTQRGVNWEMLEDYGNLDQMTLFAFYCFNAGATVVPFRPIGHQTNEVVLDNDDPGVSFAGTWFNSTATIFYGSASDVPYRYATLDGTETATATYTPNIPQAGFYPIYTWVRVGSDRGHQRYRIRHTGGESQVRVPHHMVGSGWIYLGTYYLYPGANATSGSVIVSNLRSTTNGTYTFADAIRFGNGMGSINRGGGVSGYPREEECARYWVQAGLGQGQSTSLYDGSGDDNSDNVGAPPRMAAEMNRETAGTMFKRLYIGFHSNASGLGTNSTARGDVGLYNNESLFPGSSTSNQFRLAEIIATNVNNTLKTITVPTFEVGWTNNRSSLTYARSDFAFGEIRGNTINWEMDATILEVAFHDNYYDALLMRDPKVRNWMARATYQGVVRYMNQFEGVPLNFLPEPPGNVRATATTNGIRISWNAPVAEFGTGAATGYVVYQSTNGFGFGNPARINGSATTSFTLTNLVSDTDYYFHVAAFNAGGESVPSATVGCRRSSNPMQSRILFVNAFDRFDRTTNLRHTPTAQNYMPPGNSGTMERVMPRANNAFDYVVQHGKAISAFGMPFDSCHRQAISNNAVALTDYQIVIWEAGQNLTNNFRSAERNVITNFQSGGGHLFVSGADIAWDLDRASGPTAADRAFLNNWLRADLGGDANHNSGSYTFSPAADSIFSGRGTGTFDNGRQGIYWVQALDRLTPLGIGTIAALNYLGGLGGAAAVQYDGAAGGGRMVYFGFPFETITSASLRGTYMADILRFFSKPARFDVIVLLPDKRTQITLSAEPGITYAVQVSSNLTMWSALTNVVNVNGMFGFVDGQATNERQRFYRVVLAP